MIRKAFRMSVHPDRHAEYARRHNPIWPELEAVLLQHGVCSYSIFLDEETSDLFACVEVESESQWNAIVQTEPCQRWWRFMKDIMPTNPDNSPVTHELKEVFHIEGA
jgi:L-rhamnose mutarotase